MTEQQRQLWRYRSATICTGIMVFAAIASLGYAAYVLAWALNK